MSFAYFCILLVDGTGSNTIIHNSIFSKKNCATADGVLRLQLNETSLGKIPVQPMSYDDAYKFMA